MTECVACHEPIVAASNVKVYWLRDRTGRELCMRCLADAVVDMAIEKQERTRHYATLREQLPWLNEGTSSE